MALWRHPLRKARKALFEKRYDYAPEPLDVARLDSAVVFIPKRIGDGMAIFPVIRALQARGVPRIVVVASRYNAMVFERLEGDGLEIVTVADARDGESLQRVAREITARHGRIDLCVEATMRADATAVGFVGTLRARSNLQISNSPMRCYSPLSAPAQALHDGGESRPRCWAALMRDAGIAEVPGAFEFPLASHVEAEAAAVLAPLGPYVALNMDGSQASRQLPLARARGLCRLLHDRYGLPIVTVCAPDGEAKARALADALPFVHRPALALSLPHSAAIVKLASLVVTPDTAILHMASAYDRPVLGLFARRQDRWRPLSRQSAMVVVGGPLEDLDMEEVADRLATLAPALAAPLPECPDTARAK